MSSVASSSVASSSVASSSVVPADQWLESQQFRSYLTRWSNFEQAESPDTAPCILEEGTASSPSFLEFIKSLFEKMSLTGLANSIYKDVHYIIKYIQNDVRFLRKDALGTASEYNIWISQIARIGRVEQGVRIPFYVAIGGKEENAKDPKWIIQQVGVLLDRMACCSRYLEDRLQDCQQILRAAQQQATADQVFLEESNSIWTDALIDAEIKVHFWLNPALFANLRHISKTLERFLAEVRCYSIRSQLYRCWDCSTWGCGPVEWNYISLSYLMNISNTYFIDELYQAWSLASQLVWLRESYAKPLPLHSLRELVLHPLGPEQEAWLAAGHNTEPRESPQDTGPLQLQTERDISLVRPFGQWMVTHCTEEQQHDLLQLLIKVSLVDGPALQQYVAFARALLPPNPFPEEVPLPEELSVVLQEGGEKNHKICVRGQHWQLYWNGQDSYVQAYARNYFDRLIQLHQDQVMRVCPARVMVEGGYAQLRPAPVMVVQALRSPERRDEAEHHLLRALTTWFLAGELPASVRLEDLAFQGESVVALCPLQPERELCFDLLSRLLFELYSTIGSQRYRALMRGSRLGSSWEQVALVLVGGPDGPSPQGKIHAAIQTLMVDGFCPRFSRWALRQGVQYRDSVGRAMTRLQSLLLERYLPLEAVISQEVLWLAVRKEILAYGPALWAPDYCIDTALRSVAALYDARLQDPIEVVVKVLKAMQHGEMELLELARQHGMVSDRELGPLALLIRALGAEPSDDTLCQLLHMLQASPARLCQAHRHDLPWSTPIIESLARFYGSGWVDLPTQGPDPVAASSSSL